MVGPQVLILPGWRIRRLRRDFWRDAAEVTDEPGRLQKHRGHSTDKAVIAGLLDMDIDYKNREAWILPRTGYRFQFMLSILRMSILTP